MYVKENRIINLELYPDGCWTSYVPAEHLGNITGMHWDYANYLDNFVHRQELCYNSVSLPDLFNFSVNLSSQVVKPSIPIEELPELLRDFVNWYVLGNLTNESKESDEEHILNSK